MVDVLIRIIVFPFALAALVIKRFLQVIEFVFQTKGVPPLLTPRIKEPPPFEEFLTIPRTEAQVPLDDKPALWALYLLHEKHANKGSAESQYLLGGMCERMFERLRQEQDSEGSSVSAKWYLRAAEQGHPKAMYQLGLCYQCGYGVERSDKKAIKWLRKASRLGHAPSFTRIGVAYLSGEGVWRDNRTAMQYLLVGAAKGDPKGQAIVADILQESENPSDQREAFDWYMKAAHGGESSAMLQAGIMLSNGRGTPQDIEAAVQWLTKAAEAGEEEAASHLDLLRNGSSSQ